MVEESQSARAEGEPGAPPPEYWPRREDTREFQPVALAEDPGEAPQLPPVTESDAEEDDGPWAGRDFAWG
jgi:hypothetical protein